MAKATPQNIENVHKGFWTQVGVEHLLSSSLVPTSRGMKDLSHSFPLLEYQLVWRRGWFELVYQGAGGNLWSNFGFQGKSWQRQQHVQIKRVYNEMQMESLLVISPWITKSRNDEGPTVRTNCQNSGLLKLWIRLTTQVGVCRIMDLELPPWQQQDCSLLTNNHPSTVWSL